jgi:antitoxin Phd
MSTWQVQHAKARFSELLDAALENGPQIVTRRGTEAAVLVPIEQWRRLQSQARRSAKEVLLGPGPRFDNIVPSRGRFRRRPVIVFK